MLALSVPSILFAVSQASEGQKSVFTSKLCLEFTSQALPAGNTSGLSQQTLQITHRAAPALIVAVDMLLASAWPAMLATCYLCISDMLGT